MSDTVNGYDIHGVFHGVEQAQPVGAALEAERVAFEAAYSGEFGTPISVLKLLRESDDYIEKPQHSDRLSSSWWAWRARAQLASSDTAELLREIECLKSAVLVSQRSAVAISKELRAQLAAPPPAPASEAIAEAQNWCDENGGTPAEFLGYQLLVKRSDLLGRQLTWAETIEITALVTNMPEAEKQQLLAMDDEPASDVVQVPRELLSAVFRHADNPEKELSPGIGAPGHSHRVPGHWDRDGSKCEACAAYDALRALLNGGRV